MGAHAAIADDSEVSRLGLRQGVGEAGELRALLSRQRTSQHMSLEDFSVPPPPRPRRTAAASRRA